MPVVTRFTCRINEALRITHQVTSDGTSLGTPVDISGWTLRLTIQKVDGDDTPLKQCTIGAGSVVISSPQAGISTIVVPNSDIVSLGVGDYFYHIDRVDSGYEAEATEGSFSILPV